MKLGRGKRLNCALRAVVPLGERVERPTERGAGPGQPGDRHPDLGSRGLVRGRTDQFLRRV